MNETDAIQVDAFDDEPQKRALPAMIVAHIHAQCPAELFTVLEFSQNTSGGWMPKEVWELLDSEITPIPTEAENRSLATSAT